MFITLQTQWRYGFDGITGLDYSAVIAVIKLHYQDNQQQLERLTDIQALELGALTAINEQRKKAQEANDRNRKHG